MQFLLIALYGQYQNMNEGKYKDNLEVGETSNVIYQIPYMNCPCDYVKQMGRMLTIRLQKHKQVLR